MIRPCILRLAVILMKIILAITVILWSFMNNTVQAAEQEFNLHENLMQATFYAHGPSKEFPGKESCGTVFFLIHPFEGEDESVSGWKGDLVLVTATHVLEQISGDYLTIDLRKKTSDGEWERTPTKFRIRKDGKDIFNKHPDADVAVMWGIDGIENSQAVLFKDVVAVPTFLLTTDEKFKQLKLNTGSTLVCLGYPLCKSTNEEGFSILRGGMISSYPIFPMLKRKTFNFDFEVYPGNSGGPVYYFEPGYEAKSTIITLKKSDGMTIAGLVTAQHFNDQVVGKTPDGKIAVERTFLKLGRVVTGPVISETISSLRKRKKPQSVL